MSQIDSKLDPAGLYSNPLDDHEYNGALNHATGQGAKFALLLAMLEQNTLWRPTIAKDDEAEQTYQDALAGLSFYRTAKLAADEDYWAKVACTESLIESGELGNARLWLAMHPEPLSLYNDRLRISDEVIENCALPVRERFKLSQQYSPQQQSQQKQFTQDATGLYDILQNLEPQHQAA